MISNYTQPLLKAFRSGIEEIEVREAQGGPHKFTEASQSFTALLRSMGPQQMTMVIIEMTGTIVTLEAEINEMKLEALNAEA